MVVHSSNTKSLFLTNFFSQQFSEWWFRNRFRLSKGYEVKRKSIFEILDSYIRHNMRKQWISIVKNTYTGLDTEFNTMEIARNSLVYAQ